MRHGIRIAAIWLVATIIVEVLIGIVPIPSPALSSEALGEHQTVYMLFYVGAPVFVFVWVLFAYALIVFRRHAGEEAEPVATPDSTPILLIWAGLSFLVVLFLAGWGTFTLHEITSPPSPSIAVAKTAARQGTHTALVAHPAKTLDVQVIGQQWQWTYRYPSYGAMETKELVLPVNTPIEFNITSLDVVHSFWIYQYDIKEDAVPGVSNTAWLLAKQTGSTTKDGRFMVQCNELCGIWHGYMRTNLAVVSKAAFASWATKQEASERSSGLLRNLPKYALLYYPASNSNWPSLPENQSP